MTELWCELAWLGGGAGAGADAEAEAGVLISVDGDRIFALRSGVARPPDGAVALRGLTLPGLANAHSHAFQRMLRGRTERSAGSFWSWRAAMYDLVDRLDPEGLYRIARATYGEMLLAGITCVGEFHYLHHDRGGAPYAPPSAMGDALVAAAQDVGIRLTLIDTCYLHGGIDQPLEGAQQRFGDDDADRWASRASRRADGPRSRFAAGIHSVRAVDPDAMAVVAGWARDRGSVLHVHLSEQPAENAACHAAYGCSPTALLARAGVLDTQVTAVHATHLDPEDVAGLGAAGATVCLCPTTERDLADGIGPSEALAAAGCGLAVGTDSHAVIDVLVEAREVELHQRLATGRRGIHAPAQLLEAATASGYRSLGWPEGGRLAPGALADLVALRLDSVRLAGTDRRTAVDAAVFAATAGDVDQVMVGGRFVVQDGNHVDLDVVAELTAVTSGSGPWVSTDLERQ
ncbi:MAG: formimidoylglutamate deiminase [Acidimicrobiales bacterium]